MGERGPKPSKKLKVVKPYVPRRPNPPRGLNSKARHIWTTVVNAYPVDHFKPQHRELLRMYCGACVLQKKAEKEYLKNGEVITQKNGVTKENPYVNIAKKAEASAIRLATKLGITVNNTTVNRGIKGFVKSPKSKREGLIYRGDE